MHFRLKKGEQNRTERNGTDNTHFIPNNFFTIYEKEQEMRR